MNEKRREKLSDLTIIIFDLIDKLESIRKEEQNYFNKIPISLNETDRYNKSKKILAMLSSALADLIKASINIELAQQ